MPDGPAMIRLRGNCVQVEQTDDAIPAVEDPTDLFAQWYADAEASEPNDPNAMALATVGESGMPSVRMVLLKGHGPEGFVFYTNLDSRKGRELAANPQAALLFHWKSLRRQVRVEGTVEAVDAAAADAYFASRGRHSQLGAAVSQQSEPLASRQQLLSEIAAAEALHTGRPVPRPERWAGFRLVPVAMEFWHDREHRLHDRRRFERLGSGWTSGLLYP